MEIDSEVIITEVQKYPCLYDFKDQSYKDRELRKSSWMSVTAAVIGRNWEKLETKKKLQTAKEVKNRWKNMKDTYIKSIRDQEAKTGVTGRPRRKYIYHKRLSFLNLSTQRRQTSMKTNASQIKNCSLKNANEQSEIFVSTQNVSRLSKKQNADAHEKEIICSVRSINNDADQSFTDKHVLGIPDPDEMFLLSQIPMIKQLSAHDKLDFQIKFMQLLQSYTTLHDTSSSHSYKIVRNSTCTSPASLEKDNVNYTSVETSSMSNYNDEDDSNFKL